MAGVIFKDRLNHYTRQYDEVLKSKYPHITREEPYITCDEKIKHSCQLHGSFYRRPTSLRNSPYGCPKCGIKSNADAKYKSEQSIIDRLFVCHGDKITLDEPYRAIDKHHRFICNSGHAWKAVPSSVLSGRGCPTCAKQKRGLDLAKTNQQIVNQLFSTHGNAIKLNELYKHAINKNHEFICSKGHTWETSLGNILYSRSGCPYCHNASSSKPEKQWLALLNNKNIVENALLRIEGISYTVRPDGYDPTTKTIYEFYGDYWHGHISLWNSSRKVRGLSMREVNMKTRKKEKALLKAGYKVVYCWEYDFKRYLKSKFRYKRVPFRVAQLSKSPYCY